MEQKLLGAALNDIDACLQLNQYLDKDTLTPEGQLIFEAAVQFYQLDPEAEKVDRELLASGLERQVQNQKLYQLLLNTLKGIPSEVSIPNIVKEVKEHKLFILG